MVEGRIISSALGVKSKINEIRQTDLWEMLLCDLHCNQFESVFCFNAAVKAWTSGEVITQHLFIETVSFPEN